MIKCLHHVDVFHGSQAQDSQFNHSLSASIERARASSHSVFPQNLHQGH